MVSGVPREPCGHCGKPRWLSRDAYYRGGHLLGAMFIPPAPGELCECDRDDDKALEGRLRDAARNNQLLRERLRAIRCQPGAR